MTDQEAREERRPEVWARRLLQAQDVAHGPLRWRSTAEARPVHPLDVAAVLHALADHTHNAHMLRLLAVEGDRLGEPQVTILGRYFHSLGDVIEYGYDLGTPAGEGER